METGEPKESELYCPKCGALGSLKRTEAGRNYKHCKHCGQTIYMMFLPAGNLSSKDFTDIPERAEPSCTKGMCDY